jgi:hypothetical protein
LAEDKSTVRGKTHSDIKSHILSINKEYLHTKQQTKRQKKLPFGLETGHYIEMINRKLSKIRKPLEKRYLNFNHQDSGTQFGLKAISYSASTLASLPETALDDAATLEMPCSPPYFSLLKESVNEEADHHPNTNSNIWQKNTDLQAYIKEELTPKSIEDLSKVIPKQDHDRSEKDSLSVQNRDAIFPDNFFNSQKIKDESITWELKEESTPKSIEDLAKVFPEQDRDGSERGSLPVQNREDISPDNLFNSQKIKAGSMIWVSWSESENIFSAIIDSITNEYVCITFVSAGKKYLWGLLIFRQLWSS